MLIADQVSRAARHYPRHIAAICGDEERTHQEIDARSNRLANALLSLGLQRGERVIVLLENSIRCIEVDFGLAKAGLVRVSLNPRISAPELDYILKDAEPSTVIFGSNFAPLIGPALATAPGGVRHIVRIAEPYADEAPAAGLDYEALLAGALSQTPRAQVSEDDLHSIAYTSGSTGRPKGVTLTQRAIVQVAYNVLMELGPEAPGEKVLLLQPLSHGSAYFVLAYYMRGCAVVLMRQFTAPGALRLMTELRIETAKMVPTMLQRLLAQPDIEQMDFSHLRQIIYGGSHIASDVLGRAIRLLGPKLAQHYGQTEAPSTLTVLSRHEHTLENLAAGVLTSAGCAWSSVEARIANAEGEEVPCGEVGELLVRAPHMMFGYWKQPELTAKALRGGWLHTNDLGRMDERGFIHLLGRQDEMIISGGFNIAPREIEDALCNHPAVAEAAVLGKADAEWGHIVFAFVSAREPGLTRETLVEFTRNTLGYKRPKEIVFLQELPKNANGKVDKTVLKRLMTAGETR